MTKTIVMNSKLQYGKIIEDSTKGNFKVVLEYITQNLEDKIDHKKALNILVACCNACVYCKESISEHSLLQILKNVYPYLKDFNEADIISYVQSLYHFIKFFIYKGQLEYIVYIEDIAIATFLSSSKISKKQKDTYNNISKLLYNVVGKSAVENNICNEVLFKISRFMLRICIHLEDSTAIVNLTSGCFKNLSSIKLSLHYQIEYYKEFLDLLVQYRVELKSEDLVKIVINFSSHILYNIIVTYDFENGLQFLIATISQLQNVLNSEDCQLFQQSLQLCLILPCQTLKDKYSEINKCIQSIQKIDQLDIIVLKKDFVQYFSKLLQILKEYYTNINSKEWISFSEEEQLLFFKSIVEVDSLLLFSKCKDGNIYNCFSGANVISSLNKTVIINSVKNLKYHQEYIKVINKYLEYVVEIKEHNFEQWSKFWNHLAAEIYNTGVQLMQKNLNEIVKHYFYLIINYFIKLEDRNNTMLLKYSIIQSVFISLIQIYTKSKENEKCLALISLGTLLCNKSRDSLMTKWITLKHNLRDNTKDNIQRINLVSSLHFLKNEVPVLKLDVKEKQFLLNLELDSYKKKWKSKIPILSAMKELQKISNDEYLANVIVKLFVDIDLPNHEELYNIAAEVLETCKNKSTTISSKINLAILYYIHYKYCSKQVILKNAEDMESVASVVPMKNDSDLNDPKDDCDIISSFESLHLDVFKENLENLETSLSIFTSLVPLIKTDNHDLTLNQLYNVLLSISFEFKLLCYKVKAVQALQLALTIAQLQKNSSNIIKTIGLILEQVDIQEQNTQKLLDLADDLMEDKTFSQKDNLDISLTYYISKSKALLYMDYKESYKVYKKANSLFEQVKDTHCLGTVKSRLFLLNSEFSMLPCNLGVKTHKNSIFMNAYLATEAMYEEYKNANIDDDPYKVSLLIEANKELVKLYHYLKCPREVRIYAKEILLLTQRLVLPLQTVSYLMYLAHADLLSDYQEDCRVKVKDMAVILGCQNRTAENGQAAMYFGQHSPSSPSLSVASFKMPQSISHKKSCDCYYCVCYEYQILALEQARLSALVNVKERNVNLAQEFFRGALNLYDRYVKKYLSNKHVVPDFLPTYGYILLNYSSHLWRIDRKSEAIDFSKMLLTLLDRKKLQNINLYNEALLQKLGYVTENIVPVPKQGLVIEIDQLQISGDKDVPKTPENNKTEVLVMAERSNFTSPKKIKIKKCLPFTFSPTELPGENVNKVVDTTAVPKIKIYSQYSERKTKRKPTMQAPVLPSTDSSVSNSNQDEALRTRTKLLTEKLKHSTKKMEPPTTTSESQTKSTGSRTNLTRKNLLTELSAPESSVENGAVRRSARTKK